MRWFGIVVVCVAASALSAFGQGAGRDVTHGDWVVTRSNDGKDLIAATSQDDDKFLAYRCFTGEQKCVHVVVMATECEDGEEYPVLINASSGALTMDCVCSENDDSYELIPKDFDAFHNILIKSNGPIGFALPLASRQFKVVRFSLNGAKKAMDAAETGARRKDSAQYQ